MLRYVLNLVQPKEPNWSGESYSTGFILQKSPSHTNLQEIQITVGTFDKNTERLNGNNVLFCVYVIGALILSFLLDFCWNEFFPFKIFAPIFISTGFLFGLSSLILKENKQWHACEHKSAILLKHKKEITVQNLKSVPKTTILCSSSLITLGLQLASSYIILALSSNNLIIILWDISSVFFIFYIITSHSQKFFLHITLILGFPAIVISLCVEKFLFLKEPSEEQYLQTEKELKAQISQSAE